MSLVAIIDFGSQVTQLIARRIRELGVYSEVFSPDQVFSSGVERPNIDAFVLSGGPGSVMGLESIPRAVKDIMQLNESFGIPVLGICYGFQILAHYFGVDVVSGESREFGKTQLSVISDSAVTRGIWRVGSVQNVWMSHSDSVVGNLPEGFCAVARSLGTGVVAMISNEDRKIYGMQFHPEVVHTCYGEKMLSNFLEIAECKIDWTVKSFLKTQIDKIKSDVGDRHVVAAVSGGVDSSVASVLMHRAIGDRLHCVFVDSGLSRKGDVEIVKSFFIDKLKMNVALVDKADLFFTRLNGVTDPEEKRKIIGRTFIEVFEQESRKLEKVAFLMQGTIYPDVIESGAGPAAAKIKSHHNVGGLPEVMNLSLIEPLRCLFKDEVRTLGAELGLPSDILNRHPFPGPGLAVRVIGEVTEERVNLLREIDHIYINLLRKSGLYDYIWQAFAVLIPVRTVGVMGDGRTYCYTCALRAVTSSDGMTADSFPFGEMDDERKLKFLELLQEASNAIIGTVGRVNRVVYDITSKPPATIEWE